MTRTPIGVHATSEPALAATLPAPTYRAQHKHISLAVEQLHDELQLNWSGSPRDIHYHDLFERIDQRAEEMALAESEHTKPDPTKYVGIAMDACALLQELQTCIAALNFFSPGDTGLGTLCQAANRINPILAKLRKGEQA